MKFIYSALVAVLLLSSCRPSGYYQKDYAITAGEWFQEQSFDYTIDINDTTADYNAFLLIRHDDRFPTSNIWLKVSVTNPEDSVPNFEQRIEFLMTDTDGKPLGKNFGDIWEQKKLLNILPKFEKTGTYKITVAQVMRSNPLEGVLNVGVQLEKKSK